MRSVLQNRGRYLVCASTALMREPVVRLRRGGYQPATLAAGLARLGGAGRRGWAMRIIRLAWSD